jgi:hypothetical protein
LHLYVNASLFRTVLLEKLTGSQLVKKFSVFYGTRRFITAFTTARHIEDKKDVISDRISRGLSVLETVESPYSQ